MGVPVDPKKSFDTWRTLLRVGWMAVLPVGCAFVIYISKVMRLRVDPQEGLH
jgi:hypothetical protein